MGIHTPAWYFRPGALPHATSVLAAFRVCVLCNPPWSHSLDTPAQKAVCPNQGYAYQYYMVNRLSALKINAQFSSPQPEPRATTATIF